MGSPRYEDQSDTLVRDSKSNNPICFDGTPAGDILNYFCKINRWAVNDLHKIHDGLSNVEEFFDKKLLRIELIRLISEYCKKIEELGLEHDSISEWMESKKPCKTWAQRIFGQQMMKLVDKMNDL